MLLINLVCWFNYIRECVCWNLEFEAKTCKYNYIRILGRVRLRFFFLVHNKKFLFWTWNCLTYLEEIWMCPCSQEDWSTFKASRKDPCQFQPTWSHINVNIKLLANIIKLCKLLVYKKDSIEKSFSHISTTNSCSKLKRLQKYDH